MKNRICLAWFGDLDVPRSGRQKMKKAAGPGSGGPSVRSRQGKDKDGTTDRKSGSR